MSDTAYEVVHSLPGRMRLRVRAIRSDAPLASGLQDLLNSQDGVRLARANPYCASITVNFNPEAFDPIAWFDKLQMDQVRRIEPKSEGTFKLPSPLSALRRGTFSLEAMVSPEAQCLLGAVSLVSSLVGAPAFITRTALSAAVLPILNRALQTLLDEKRLGGDALDGVSCLILMRQRSFVPAALMTLLISVGELMRDVITRGCQRMIFHQLALSQRSAWLINGPKRVRVPVLELRPGDRLVVYPGELVGFEGTVLAGQGTVNPASPEMDFAPQHVRRGDVVAADSILMDGKLYLRFERSTIRRPPDPVREKQKRRWLQRTRMHRFALHAAYEKVYPLLGAAALIFAGTRNIERALTLVCFDFITGIRIAIPTAVLASMYKAGRRGVVMRSASTLERLSEIDAVIFARSGTLTQLKPFITEIHVSDGYALNDVTRLAAAVQQRYSTLGAYAIYNYTKKQSIPVPERTSSTILPGLGVEGEVDGQSVLVGSTHFMQTREIDLSSAHDFLQQCIERGDSRICVALSGKLAGVIAYQDPVRKEAKKVISALNGMGIAEVSMMTSGSQSAAETLASKAGISRVHFRALPEDMAKIVREYKDRGLKVAVVGDDVADALAMEQADLAITLSHGADVARFRADMVLTSDNLSGLVDAIKIARNGMSIARQNLVVTSIPNWIGLYLSLTQQTNFLAATLLNNGSVIVGAANGLRPLLDRG